MRASQGGIGVALIRVDVVLGNELAWMSLKSRVVGEKDAGAKLDRPSTEVRRMLRQGRGCEWADLHRYREIVVGVKALEDMDSDVIGIVVVNPRGVKAVLQIGRA